jgi:hypothetical protein
MVTVEEMIVKIAVLAATMATVVAMIAEAAPVVKAAIVASTKNL